MLRASLLFGVLACLAACEVTPEERTEQACTALCGCEAAPLPGVQNQCMAQCRQELDSSEISDQCVECVIDNADRCTTLQLVCEPACSIEPPVDIADAGIGPL